MKYGLENYTYEDVYEYNKKFPKIEVENGVPHNQKLHQKVYIPVAIKPEAIKVLKRADEKINIIYDIPSKLKAPIKKGEKIGAVTYYLGEKKIMEIPLTAGKNTEKLEFSWYAEYLLERFWMKKGLCTKVL